MSHLSVPSSSGVVPNPLGAFKRNARTTNIIVEDILPVERQIERSRRWLFDDSLDITFGIKGNNKDVNIRRAYRRIKSSALFRKQPRSEVSLEDIHAKAQPLPPPKRYILIEESRLAGLRRVEKILADERLLLEEQCCLLAGTTDSSSGASLDPATPTPAAKIAIDKMYESKIHLVGGKLSSLQQRFREYCERNERSARSMRPANPTLSLTNLIPLEQRLMRYKHEQEASLALRAQLEWDCMSYEDDLSYLSSLLLDLVVRRRDYNTYYVLATRYGEYEPEEFYGDRQPGARYYRAVTAAALTIQREWAAYWAVEAARREAATSKVQRCYRFWWAYKKYHPLIIFRMRFGKRSYYAFCWGRWLSYNRMIRMCKEAIAFALQSPYYRMCFESWRTLHRQTKERNQETLRLNLIKMMNAGMFKCFGVWKGIVQDKKRRILTLRRKFKNPHFEKWIRFTEYSRGYRRMEGAAVVLQKYHRMFRALRAYRIWLRGKQVFRSLCVLKQKRAAYTEQHIGAWLPSAAENKHAAAAQAEKKRLLAKHIRLAKAEAEASARMLKFLDTKDGKRQLKRLGATVVKTHYADPVLLEQLGGRSDVLHLARISLLRRCIQVSREREAHDFDAKNPAPLRCPDPACGATLLSAEGFLVHARLSDRHQGLDAGLLDKLYSALRDPVRTLLLQQYLQAQEQGALGYCLELYVEIERWRALESSSAEYYSSGRSIFETFVPRRAKKECSLGADAHSDTQALRAVFAAQPTAPVFYKQVAGERSALRRLLGLNARLYDEWTDELLLGPSRFYRLQWLAMRRLYDHLAANAAAFASSAAHAGIVAREEALARAAVKQGKQEFKLHYYNTCFAWAAALKKRANAVDALGAAAADRVFSLLVAELADRATEVCIDKLLFGLFDAEQRPHEKAQAMAADAVLWVRDTVAEDLYSSVLRAMLQAMGSNAAQREQLMVLAGLRERKIKKAKTISMRVAKTQALGMLDSLF